MSIYSKLFDYQKKIVDNNINKNAYGLFVDMGLGKTPMSLAFAEKHNCTKILIITTASKATEDKTVHGSFFYWAAQSSIKYNLYDKRYNFDNKGAKKWRAQISPDTVDIFMTNHESTFIRGGENTRNTSMLNKQVYEFIESCRNQNVAIIVDESHKIKSRSSSRTKALMKIKSLCDTISKNTYLYLLTGTPFTKGFEDLYTQLNLLGWDKSWTTFKETFCVMGNIPSLTSWQQPIVDYKNIPLLFNLVHNYAVTIKSEEVLDLPEQIFVYHELPLNQQMLLFTCKKLRAQIINKELNARHINEFVKPGEKDGKVNNMFYANIAYPNLNWLADSVTKFYTRARQLSIGFQGNSENAMWFQKARLAELEKLLTEHEDNYILFYNYTPEFVEIYDMCERLGYKIDVCNGLIKSETFYNEYCNLSEGLKLVEKKRIMLVNYGSGSEGKNWQEYDKCILFSLPVFKDWQQGLKRIHRPGQKNNVIYHVFYENNWLDRRMMESLKEKKIYDENMFMNDLARIDNLIAEDLQVK